MSVSLLYHGFGIRGYRHQRMTFEGGTVILTSRQKRKNLRCPECGSADVERRGQVTRTFQHVPRSDTSRCSSNWTWPASADETAASPGR